MTDSQNMLSVFASAIKEEDGEYYIEVPSNEIEHGPLNEGEDIQVVIREQEGNVSIQGQGNQHQHKNQHQHNSGGSRNRSRNGGRNNSHDQQPVSTGDVKRVNIESIGDQGDGIARVDRGYVLIIPDTEVGDEAKVRVTNVNENYADAEVIEYLNRTRQ